MDIADEERTSLCDACQRLCRGHWTQTPGTSTWQVHVRSEDDNGEIEPLKLSFFDLQRSAKNGCDLCAAFLGTFSKKHVEELNSSGALLVKDISKLDYFMTPEGNNIVLLLFHSFKHIDGRNLNTYGLLLTPVEAHSIVDRSHWISQKKSSENRTRQVREWLKDCETQHGKCRQETASPTTGPKTLPGRLIDVGTVASPNTKLVHSKDLRTDVEYFTLSHCWGLEIPMKLTSDCREEFLVEIKYAELPKTFKDAVDMSRILNSRYLWIDALCIVQDSTEDWLQESSKMGQIYSNSRLNLAATASSDSHGGLHREMDPRVMKRCVLRPQWSGLGQLHPSYLFMDVGLWETSVEDAPLQGRGWVLQERILAPRVLHFAESQLFWECCTKSASESFPTELPVSICGSFKSWPINSASSRHIFRSQMQAKWSEIVFAYSTATLTFNKDKLIAISGVARKMLEMWQGSATDYAAGLWKDSLPYGLLWWVEQEYATRSKTYRAPSWSWASIDGEVFPPPQDLRNSLISPSEAKHYPQCLMHVVEIKIMPPDNLSAFIENGHIRLQGRMCRMEKRVVKNSLRAQPEFDDFIQDESSNFAVNEWQVHGHTLFLPDAHIDERTPIGISIYYFMAFWEYEMLNSRGNSLAGMILQPSGGGNGEYRRCGILRLYDSGDADDDGRKAMTVVKAALESETLDKSEYEEMTEDCRYTIKVI